MDDWAVLSWVGVAGVATSILTIVVALVMAWRRDNKVSRADTSDLGAEPPPTAAEWKFSDSWASNLTALIAAIAAIVAAFGDDLGSAVSKLQAAEFAVAVAAMVALAATAPVAYVAFSRVKGRTNEGTVTGLVVAAFLTLTATFGSLGALEWMIWYKPATQPLPSGVTEIFIERDLPWWIRAVPVLVALLVAVYAIRTVVALIGWFRKPSRRANDHEIVGMMSRTCCAGDEPRLRVTLL